MEHFGLRQKKKPIVIFWMSFSNCWCLVVTLVTFSSNLDSFEREKINEKEEKIQQKKTLNKSNKKSKLIKNILNKAKKNRNI